MFTALSESEIGAWPPGDAARRLISGRAACMPLTDSRRRKHAGKSSAQLIELLNNTRDFTDRRAIGVLIATAFAEEAARLRSFDRIDDFLFRFGYHLFESARASGIPENRRGALLSAARQVFRTMYPRPRELVNRIQAELGRVKVPATSFAWKEAVGMDAFTFTQQLERIQVSRPVVVERSKRVPSSDDKSWPRWLRLPSSEGSDALVLFTANWDLDQSADYGEVDPQQVLQSAWNAFRVGKIEEAWLLLEPIRRGAGDMWGPSGDIDSQFLWAWLRLITFLAGVSSGRVGGERLAALSSLELVERLGIQGDLGAIDELGDQILGDLHPIDARTRREWAVLTARTATISGHEYVVADVDNQTKAEMREAWAAQFVGPRLSPDETTHDMAWKIKQRLRELQEIAFSLVRETRHVPPAMLDLANRLREYWTAPEAVLGDKSEEIIREWLSITESSDALPNIGVLDKLETNIADVVEQIRHSQSLLLQETFLPMLKSVSLSLTHVHERLSSVSRPAVEVELQSDRLPLTGSIGREVNVVVTLRNTGNAEARAIELELSNETLELPQPSVGCGNLLPGAEREVVFAATSSTEQTSSLLRISARWSDDYEQEFNTTFDLHAENQRPSTWTEDDENPFVLSSIADPARLVGRDSDLRALDTILRARGSTYVYGQKRVGKTSLVKVLLKLLEERGASTAFTSLGRLIGEEPTPADVVQGLVEALEDALDNSYPNLELPPLDGEALRTNFARTAGRWIDQVRKVLPDSAQAVIAIDDFDEIPTDLLEGRSGDALFLFLRTLVDEPWLSLVFVGSEVLPNVMRTQGYKLNQLIPTYVANFRSRTDTAQLAIIPSRERLDWEENALDHLHFLSSGNPYYATLLAQHVWQRLYDRRRTQVYLHDLHAAATDIESAPPPHFVHLWADDPSGIDPAAERSQVASAVLRAAARCSYGLARGAPRHEVTAVAQEWVPAVPRGVVEEAQMSLLSRGVLVEVDPGETIRLAIPLVEMWLRASGSRFLDDEYRASAIARASQAVVTSGDLVRVADGLYYVGEHVNELRIEAWLDQFQSSEARYLAFKLVERLATFGYFSHDRLQREALPNLRRDILKGIAGQHQRLDTKSQYLLNFFVLDHGAPGSSAPGMVSAICKTLRIRKTSNVVTLDSVASRIAPIDTPVLLVIDDFAGTGNHLREAVERLSAVLDEKEPTWRDRMIVVVGACVSAAEASFETMDWGCECYGVSGVVIDEQLQAFHPDAKIFESDDERKTAQDILTAIGKSLLPDNPLGYGGRGLLVLLEQNCPNNSLPALWRSGDYAGREWRPLFERRF